MANIQTDACPNFTGSAHDNAHLAFVPQQLHGAHLHPLKALGSVKQSKNADGIYEDTIDKKTGEPILDEKTPGRGKYPLNWSAHEEGLKSGDKRYGVCLTRSRLFVLDIDTHNGVDGNASLATVCSELGLDGLDTFTVATGTGGFHYYFQLPDALSEREIKKSVNLWPGVDVFPQNQQVVGPGSKRTLEDGSIGRYEVSNDAEIASMPDVLVQAIMERIEENYADKKRARVSAPCAGEYRPRHTGNSLSEKQHEVLSSMCGELSGAQAGERHATILRVAFNAGCFFGPELEATVYPEIQAAAFASGHDENCGCVEDAFQSGMQVWQPFVPEPPSYSTNIAREPKSKKKIKLPKLDPFFFSEIGMAREFASTQEDRLLSVDEWNAWAKYQGASGKWERTKPAVVDSDFMAWYADEMYPAIEKKLKKQVDAVGDDAKAKAEAQDVRKKQQAKAQRFLNLPSCKNATKYVFGTVMRPANIFDPRGDEILTDGVAVSLRDGTQRVAKPSDFFTLSGAAEYLPGYTHPLWEEILSAFDPECLPYLQVIMGQALTGYQPSDSAIHFLEGGGSNGKSTFLDVIMAVFGDYADAPDSSILMKGGADSFSKSVFKGLRMALLEETAESQWLDDKIIKKLAGTDKMRGAKKFQDEETFDMIATVFITTNELPQVSANDDGTWRRLKVFPMPYKFVDPHEYDADTSPGHHRPRNPALTRAKDNADIRRAALAWVVKGAMIWFDQDETELPQPEAMLAKHRGWRGRQDKIATWWEEWIQSGTDSYCTVPDLYTTYKQSLADNGRKGEESKAKFMAALESHALFQEADAEYVKQQRPSGLIHSPLPEEIANPYDRETSATKASKARYFVRGIRFAR
ncbi:hypothetical protein GCM10009847_10690 [Leucobacter tardus]|uniref:Bifunctional DNA primase/polymerase n=1 Tax=Leucobacter tardus TaxID=501483 RepID=A0A939TU11_9MICO|nr:phage/plasmid primase, P4 family [Leucobacter tardus]MBO2989265.1 bifunctional DNA primase/polymerase [Leucobacter tardus]